MSEGAVGFGLSFGFLFVRWLKLKPRRVRGNRVVDDWPMGGVTAVDQSEFAGQLKKWPYSTSLSGESKAFSPLFDRPYLSNFSFVASRRPGRLIGVTCYGNRGAKAAGNQRDGPSGQHSADW